MAIKLWRNLDLDLLNFSFIPYHLTPWPYSVTQHRNITSYNHSVNASDLWI